MFTMTVAVAELSLSPKNVRTDTSDITDLAESIDRFGLLAPLVVEQVGDKYEVVAGGRRLRAIQTLPAILQVPVVILDPDSDTTTISLIENTHRRQLHPAEEFKAFAQLAEQGKDAESIAALFNTTVRHVLGRMRLGQLHPTVFDAYADGDITLDAAKAYASCADTQKQIAVFNEQGSDRWNKNNTYQIRHALKTGSHHHQEAQLEYVGKAAYKKAGGRLEEDLFDDVTLILDADLLDQLAQKKMQRAAKILVADYPHVTLVDKDYGVGLRVYNSDAALEEGEPLLAVATLGYDNDVRLVLYREPEAVVEGQSTVTAEHMPTEVPINPMTDGLSLRAAGYYAQTRRDMLRAEVQRADYLGRYRTDLYLYLHAGRNNHLPDTMTFDEFAASNDEYKDQIAAALFAGEIKELHLHSKSTLAIDELGWRADTHARQLWQPTADYFDMFKKTQLLEMAKEMGLTDSYVNSNMKMDELRTRILNAATNSTESPGIPADQLATAWAWIPAQLRFSQEDARASATPAEEDSPPWEVAAIEEVEHA